MFAGANGGKTQVGRVLLVVGGGAAVVVLACRPDRQPTPASATTAATANTTYLSRAEAEHVFSALAAGDTEAAERKFSARMRTELPPLLLQVAWRGLVARSGAFRSFSIITSRQRF